MSNLKLTVNLDMREVFRQFVAESGHAALVKAIMEHCADQVLPVFEDKLFEALKKFREDNAP
jgi:DNA replication protein DnaC